MLRRREFIKLLSTTVTTIFIVPVDAIADNKYKDFDPSVELMDYVIITDIVDVTDKNDPVITQCKDIFMKQIEEVIPPKFRSKVSWIVTGYGSSGTVDCAQRSTLAWKYTP